MKHMRQFENYIRGEWGSDEDITPETDTSVGTDTEEACFYQLADSVEEVIDGFKEEYPDILEEYTYKEILNNLINYMD